MKPILRRAFPVTLAVCAGFAGFGAPALLAAASGQASTATAPATRLLGTVTAVNKNTVTIKADDGVESIITMADGAKMLRTKPGQKNLSDATPIQVQDLAVGDRVLARATPAVDGQGYSATVLIAMSHADIAQQQQQEREEWQKNGVGGIVKSVDPATNTITVTSAGSKLLTIHTSPSTTVRRYAPNSIKFDDAKPSTLDQIHPGDQLRARGARSAAGGELTAAAMVVGSFRNIAGTVKDVNASANTITVMDLATKKPVKIQVTPDSQVRKVPSAMAETIAARFKGGAAAHGAHPAAEQGKAPAGEDLTQMLQSAPSIPISALHKGDAVMIVATQGTPEAATAITLLAGVEPMLRASATANVFSASWNLSGNGGEQAAQ